MLSVITPSVMAPFNVPTVVIIVVLKLELTDDDQDDSNGGAGCGQHWGVLEDCLWRFGGCRRGRSHSRSRSRTWGRCFGHLSVAISCILQLTAWQSFQTYTGFLYNLAVNVFEWAKFYLHLPIFIMLLHLSDFHRHFFGYFSKYSPNLLI